MTASIAHTIVGTANHNDDQGSRLDLTLQPVALTAANGAALPAGMRYTLSIPAPTSDDVANLVKGASVTLTVAVAPKTS